LDLTPADPSPLPTSELSLVHTGILPAGLYTLSIQAFVMETLFNGESVNTRATWSFSFTLSPHSVPDAGDTAVLLAAALLPFAVQAARCRPKMKKRTALLALALAGCVTQARLAVEIGLVLPPQNDFNNAGHAQRKFVAAFCDDSATD
jgi:hypothetical protein